MIKKRIEMKNDLPKTKYRSLLSVPQKAAITIAAAFLLLTGTAHAYTITVNPYPPLGPLGVFVIPTFAAGDPTGVYSINWGDGTTVLQFYNTGSAIQPVVSHAYTVGGTYTVSFVYTGGGFPTVTDTITVAGPADTINPTITITTPAADPFSTASAVVTLSGNAADNVGVTQVTWSNTTTDVTGIAAGTNVWTAAGIPLQAGANNLMVTARDAAGNSGGDSITVNYAAPAGAFGVSPAPSSATAVPGRNNVLAVTYRASSAGSLTATSSQGTFETSGGSVLGTVDSTVTLRIVNGVGIAGESVTLPAAVIEAALDRSVNRIYYRRTFDGTVQTEVAFQVLPASAGPLSLKRMELNFLLPDEAGGVEKTPRATVPRNSGYLRALADIQYDGGGTLRGVWKVDGQILGYSTRQLYRGIDTVAIESPAVPPLPTYATGRHSVTFQIEDPPPGFTEPVIFYYVSEQAGGGIAAELVLIEPAPNAVVPMPSGSAKDPVFSWQSYPQQAVYRFEIVSPLNPKMPVVQAMTEQTRYSLSRYNSGQLLSNNDYRWRVVALDGGTPVAASSYRPIIFTVREGRPGGLSLSDFTVTDEAGTGIAGESGGPRPLFRVPADGPVRVSALLENASGREAKNVTVQVLVDGSLYDALFFPVLAPGEVQEVFTDLELEEARRRTLQVRAFEEGNEGGAATIGGTILSAAAADAGAQGDAGEAGAAAVTTTETLEMTGLNVGASMVRTEPLQMTGLDVGATIVRTEPLQMTGLYSGASIRILEPVGGEQWTANESYPVRWTAEEGLGYVRIRLQRVGEETSRILVRRISSHFGLAMVDIPSNTLTGDYTLVVETLDGAVRAESDGALSIQGISGFVYPDFDVVDLQRLINPSRLVVQIQNNGVPWEGDLPVQVHFHDPDGPFSENASIDIPVSLGPGESQWFDLISPFTWQTPYDQPRLQFVVEADPAGIISEGDENNNLLSKEIRIPCGLQIDSLSSAMIYKNMPEVFLYGFFGNERCSKTVVFTDVNAPEERYRVYADQWEASSLHVYLSNVPPGLYRGVVYCTDPEQETAYSSNLSPVLRIRPRGEEYEDPFNESDPDITKTTDALNEEFLEGIEFQTTIEELWMEETQDGMEAHARIIPHRLARVVFEVWSGPMRERYTEIREFQTEEGFGGATRYHVQHVIQGLADGVYTLRCRAVEERDDGDEATVTFQVGEDQTP